MLKSEYHSDSFHAHCTLFSGPCALIPRLEQFTDPPYKRNVVLGANGFSGYLKIVVRDDGDRNEILTITNSLCGISNKLYALRRRKHSE